MIEYFAILHAGYFREECNGGFALGEKKHHVTVTNVWLFSDL